MTTETFNTIYLKYYPPLVMYANKLLEDIQAAEDVVQNVFIKLFETQDHDFEKEIAVKTWLYVSVRNACFNIIRLSKPTSSLDEDIQLIVKTDVSAEVRNLINCIAPKKCRETLQMWVNGYSLKEIAQIHGVSNNTTKNQKTRGIMLLRKSLKNNA